MSDFPNDHTISFIDSSETDNATLDIDYSEVQDAITELPVDFKITTVQDIRILEEYLASKYRKFTFLYRGHESDTYKLESTLVRATKRANENYKMICDKEIVACESFNKLVYNESWSKCMLENSNEELFKLSIARHLGMFCRLIDFSASLAVSVLFAVSDPRHYDEQEELIVLVFDKNKFINPTSTSFTEDVYYYHDSFLCDSFDELPLGEYRRLRQSGHFICVGNEYLLSEEETIKNNAINMMRIPIPSYAKVSLAQCLWRNVYGEYSFQSKIDEINNQIKK